MANENPLVGLMLKLQQLDPQQLQDVISHVNGLTDTETLTYPYPRGGWVCFHCGTRFVTEAGARLHFGETPAGSPICFTEEGLTDTARLDWLEIQVSRNNLGVLLEHIDYEFLDTPSLKKGYRIISKSLLSPPKRTLRETIDTIREIK